MQQNIYSTKWQQENEVEGCRKGTRSILALPFMATEIYQLLKINRKFLNESALTILFSASPSHTLYAALT